jgi:hypothetical protein
MRGGLNMPTIHLEAQVSTGELLKAVEQLSPPELETFVSEVLNLRAKRVAPSVPAAEAELLEEIAHGTLPKDKHRRYHELRRKFRDESQTEEEYAEMLRLSDESELLNARRIEALGKLAQLRGLSLPALMAQLGIRPCTDE